MRRLLALVLLAVFNLPLAVPIAFASDPDSRLPACCRRNGKHHCVMMMQSQPGTSGPALQAGTCPWFRGGHAIPANPRFGTFSRSQAVVSMVVSHRAPRPRAEGPYRISFSRDGQKRGPPAVV
jgi:hypothetical protein